MENNPFSMPGVKPQTNDENKSDESEILMSNSANLVEFLNKIKPEILFNPKELNFGYSQQIYKKGDMFLNKYEITNITPNFIRFRIDDYEYNLRFVER